MVFKNVFLQLYTNSTKLFDLVLYWKYVYRSENITAVCCSVLRQIILQIVCLEMDCLAIKCLQHFSIFAGSSKVKSYFLFYFV